MSRPLFATCASGILLLATVVDGSATAGERDVRLDRPRIEGSSVVFTGDAQAGARVRLERRVDGGWRRVGAERADRSGDFAITRPLPDDTSKYRVVSRRTSSTVRKVEPPVVEEPPVEEPPVEESPTDACGVRPAKSDGGYWSCTLAEDFDGTSLDTSVWTALTQSGDANGACNIDDPRTVAVEDGLLKLTVRPATEDLQCPPHPDGTRSSYVSGSVSTYYKWSQEFGRFEARFKVDDTDLPGLQEAFWLWPDVRDPDDEIWPAAGEIDIVETYSHHPGLAIPYLHYTENDNGGPIPGVNTAWHCATTRGEFHTYALEWTADRVEIFVDGQLCLSNTAGAESFHKRFIVSLTQMLGTADNRYRAVPGYAELPATMEVDYVRVWE